MVSAKHLARAVSFCLIRIFAVSLLSLLIGLAGGLRADAGDVLDARVPTLDGTTIDFGADRGKWVLVNYWATWCAACRDEAPALAQLAALPGLMVVGISDEQISIADWRSFLAAHPVTYQVALVNRAVLPAAIPPATFMLEMRPINYLIAPDGRVRKRFLGEVTFTGVTAFMH